MARQVGPPYFEGVIGGMLYYKMNGGFFVKTLPKKIGKKRFQTDERFARSRENAKEFTHLNAAGKHIRYALNPFLRQTKYKYRVAKLIGLLGQVKNCDKISIRGDRNIGEGLKTAEGRALMQGHDFNLNARLRDVFSDQDRLVIQNEGILLRKISGSDLQFPKDSNEAQLTAIFLESEPDKNEYRMYASERLVFTKDTSSQDHFLRMPEIKKRATFQIVLLSVVFCKRQLNGTVVNGDLEKNVLTILGVL
jgi:hypothetical protein